MYLLVNAEQLKTRSGRYETMPDGRSIVPMSDQRILGTLKDVDIISTARELKQLIEEQKKQMEENNPDIEVVEGDGTEDTAGEDESKTETDKKEEEVTDGQTE